MRDARGELALEPGAVLDSLFEQAAFGLALLDADRRIVRVNPLLASMPQQVIETCRRAMDESESATGLRVETPGPADGAPRIFDCTYHRVTSGDDSTAVWLTVTEVTGERGILPEVIASAPAPMAVMWGEELVFSYVNPQAQEILGHGELVGRNAADVFPAGAELAEELRDAVLVRGETARVREVPVGDGFWTFSCAPVPAPDGSIAGVLAVGQETTQETTRSRRLEAELADEHRISTQLQVSLMPDQLPAIPGIDLASGFRPAGDGSEIGGDFYDVFEVAPGCWMAVLGDVCGKGAEAAALTALTRYTLRAAAIIEGAEPATLLGQLNTAILSQRNDMRFVSAVCMFLDLDDDRAVRARVCVAGHLPPFLVYDSGAVEKLEGGAGPVLGVWEEPELTEQEVRLDPGSRMVLYTDGVLDADPGSEVDEDDLSAIVSRLGECDAAATVAGIEREVIGAAQGRDDMAVLVIRVP